MTPEEIVKTAEAAYAAQDLQRVRALFDPDVVVYWGGRKMLMGVEAVVAFERANFASWTDFQIRKTLRAVSGDTLAVEWEGSFIPKDTGKRTEMHGAEFWKMRNGRLLEWRAWSSTYTD